MPRTILLYDILITVLLLFVVVVVVFWHTIGLPHLAWPEKSSRAWEGASRRSSESRERGINPYTFIRR